jgi:hypothetical protein
MWATSMGPINAIVFEPVCLADAEGPFDDVAPALTELTAMGIQLHEAADPAHTMYIAGSKEGLVEAKSRGLVPILLASDPDEAMKLTALKPAGVVVSLLELPDFIRLLRARLPTP